LIKAIIVEDEAVAARRMQVMLEKESIQVLGILSSNQELTHYLSNAPEAEVFFMDIHLNDGSVFETLQSVDLKTPIIFTTAYDEFAIKAFKQNSVDYLLKPIDQMELQEAIQKFKSVYQKKAAFDISALSELITQQAKSYRQRIKVKIGDKIKSIKIEDVVLIYSDQKITFLRTNDHRSYPLDISVESISSELDPSLFQKVNRAQIVNINYISEVISFSNSRLKVIVESTENYEIIVARERVKEFKDWLG